MKCTTASAKVKLECQFPSVDMFWPTVCPAFFCSLFTPVIIWTYVSAFFYFFWGGGTVSFVRFGVKYKSFTLFFSFLILQIILRRTRSCVENVVPKNSIQTRSPFTRYISSADRIDPPASTPLGCLHPVMIASCSHCAFHSEEWDNSPGN